MGRDAFMSLLTVGAIRLHVERAGRGPPLLLIHDGGSTCRRDFGDLVEFYAERFSVLAPDLRGHGRSDPVDRVFWPGLTRDLHGLLRELDTGPAHVLGVGDGATLALHLALENPEDVRSLVLAAPRAYVPDEDLARLDALHPTNLEAGAPRVAQALADAHGDRWRHLLDRWVTSFRLDRAYLDVRSRLHQVECPALVVHGANDPLTPPARGEEVAKGLLHARFVLLDAGRQLARTREFVTLAEAFYRNLEEKGSPTPKDVATLGA